MLCCSTQAYIEYFNNVLVTLEENGVMSDLKTTWVSPPGGCASKSGGNLADSKISIQVRRSDSNFMSDAIAHGGWWQ